MVGNTLPLNNAHQSNFRDIDSSTTHFAQLVQELKLGRLCFVVVKRYTDVLATIIVGSRPIGRNTIVEKTSLHRLLFGDST